MRRRRSWSAASVAALLLVGCGIGSEESPRNLHLRVDDESLSIDTQVGDGFEIGASIYLVAENARLRPTTRRVQVSAEPSTHLGSVLDALIAGPDEGEVPRGLRSAVPSTTRVLGVTVDDDTAVVDLSSAFASIGGREELLAVGQVVLTVTTFPGVRRVLLNLDGRPTDLPLPDGSLADGAVALSDYASLLDPDTADTDSGSGD